MVDLGLVQKRKDIQVFSHWIMEQVHRGLEGLQFWPLSGVEVLSKDGRHHLVAFFSFDQTCISLSCCFFNEWLQAVVVVLVVVAEVGVFEGQDL